MLRRSLEESRNITAHLQQLSLELNELICTEIDKGAVKNPIYFTEIHKLVKEKIDSEPSLKEQFDAIRFRTPPPYSGEIEYGLDYLEAIGKIKMERGYFTFLDCVK